MSDGCGLVTLKWAATGRYCSALDATANAPGVCREAPRRSDADREHGRSAEGNGDGRELINPLGQSKLRPKAVRVVEVSEADRVFITFAVHGCCVLGDHNFLAVQPGFQFADGIPERFPNWDPDGGVQ
jgi:hypothetical protein